MHTSIRHLIEKIKSLASLRAKLKDIRTETYTHGLTVVIIVLTATASFGLGKLSALHSQKRPIVIENTTLPTVARVSVDSTVGQSGISSQTASVINVSGEVVASKNGDKYHLPTCSGAKSISAKNKIVFSSVAEAKKAGYLPAGNCKGLK